MNIHTIKLPCIPDERGSLVPIEFPTLPFEPQRIFYVYGVKDGCFRGDHAHYATEQFIVAVNGHLDVEYNDCQINGIIELNSPDVGVYVPPGVWTRIIFNNNAMMLVLASFPYYQFDYITDAEVFKRWKSGLK